jgi:hypothetical protein
MPYSDRIGTAALIMTFIGLGITILWPDKRWLGWLFLGIGLIGACLWLRVELPVIRSWCHKNKTATFIGSFVVCGTLGSCLIYALLSRDGAPSLLLANPAGKTEQSTSSPSSSQPLESGEKNTLGFAKPAAHKQPITKRIGPTESVHADQPKPKESSLPKEAEHRAEPTQVNEKRGCALDDEFANCTPLQMQLAARGILEEYRQSFWHYSSERHLAASAGGGQHPNMQMMADAQARFEKAYSTKFKSELLVLRRALGIRLNKVPNTGVDVEEIYPDSPYLLDTFVRGQLRDLYTLLNEFERQSGLPVLQWNDNS